MNKTNLSTKSFSPCPVTRRCYHYCQGLDILFKSNDDIWTWLLDHQTCRKVVVAHEVEHPPLSANACNAVATPNNQSRGSGIDHFTAFGESDTARIVTDSTGIKWEISVVVTEQTDTHDAIQLRTYRLRSQSQSGKMKNSSETACDSSVEKFVRVYFLRAPWSLTALPSIATFIRQIYNRLFDRTESRTEDMLIIDANNVFPDAVCSRKIPHTNDDLHRINSTVNDSTYESSENSVIENIISDDENEVGGVRNANDDDVPALQKLNKASLFVLLDSFVTSRPNHETAVTNESNEKVPKRHEKSNTENVKNVPVAVEEASSFFTDACAFLGVSIDDNQVKYLVRLAGAIIRNATSAQELERSAVCERKKFEAFLNSASSSDYYTATTIANKIKSDSSSRCKKNGDSTLSGREKLNGVKEGGVEGVEQSNKVELGEEVDEEVKVDRDGDRVGDVEVRGDEGKRRAMVAEVQRVLSLPTAEEGIKVLEFFSGIGGMRLALPDKIGGIPVKYIQAYDCSENANIVYAANFDKESEEDEGMKVLGPKYATGKLSRVLIDGLKLGEVDGRAHLWTMSPPCQPYTTTKGSHQLDGKDNRSRAFFYVMYLLRNMTRRPMWIILENVQGFLHSDVLRYWKTVLHECGYVWRQYLLSPVSSVGLPNHRMRYYMIAKYYIEGEASFPHSKPDSPSDPAPATEQLHGLEALDRDSDCDKDNSDDEEGVDDREGEGMDEINDEDGRADNDNCDVRNLRVVGAMVKEKMKLIRSDQSDLLHTSTSTSTSTSTYEEPVYTSLPIEISSRYPSTPHPIGAYTKKAEDMSSSDTESLLLPLDVLSACWAARRLSIVGKHDRRSYCFTHSYGRLYDKSSGSVLWEDAEGPLSEETYAINRSDLPSYYGRIRRFHPDELLAISGFPEGFTWPSGELLSLKKCSGVVGNSVNVAVVKCVMQALFGVTEEQQNNEEKEGDGESGGKAVVPSTANCRSSY